MFHVLLFLLSLLIAPSVSLCLVSHLMHNLSVQAAEDARKLAAEDTDVEEEDGDVGEGGGRDAAVEVEAKESATGGGGMSHLNHDADAIEDEVGDGPGDLENMSINQGRSSGKAVRGGPEPVGLRGGMDRDTSNLLGSGKSSASPSPPTPSPAATPSSVNTPSTIAINTIGVSPAANSPSSWQEKPLPGAPDDTAPERESLAKVLPPTGVQSPRLVSELDDHLPGTHHEHRADSPTQEPSTRSSVELAPQSGSVASSRSTVPVRDGGSGQNKDNMTVMTLSNNEEREVGKKKGKWICCSRSLPKETPRRSSRHINSIPVSPASSSTSGGGKRRKKREVPQTPTITSSIISSLFFVQTELAITCLKCGHTKHRPGPRGGELLPPLPLVSSKAKRLFRKQSGVIHLKDCLDAYFSPERASR